MLREYRQVCLLPLPDSYMHSAFQVPQPHPLLSKGMEGGLTVRATAGGEGEIPPKMVRGAFLRSPLRCPAACHVKLSLLDLMLKSLCSKERR